MNTATILVVDDEPQLRRAMKATLTDLGYSVIEAKTGEEALEVLRRDSPDLILLDLNMPGIGGLETCRAIRESSDVPIIVLSVRNTEHGTKWMLWTPARMTMSRNHLASRNCLRAFARPSGGHLRLRTQGPLHFRRRRAGDRFRRPARDPERNYRPADPQRIRSAQVSGGSPESADCSPETSANGLGAGLWR